MTSILNKYFKSIFSTTPGEDINTNNINTIDTADMTTIVDNLGAMTLRNDGNDLASNNNLQFLDDKTTTIEMQYALNKHYKNS